MKGGLEESTRAKDYLRKSNKEMRRCVREAASHLVAVASPDPPRELVRQPISRISS